MSKRGKKKHKQPMFQTNGINAGSIKQAHLDKIRLKIEFPMNQLLGQYAPRDSKKIISHFYHLEKGEAIISHMRNHMEIFQEWNNNPELKNPEYSSKTILTIYSRILNNLDSNLVKIIDLSQEIFLLYSRDKARSFKDTSYMTIASIAKNSMNIYRVVEIRNDCLMHREPNEEDLEKVYSHSKDFLTLFEKSISFSEMESLGIDKHYLDAKSILEAIELELLILTATASAPS